ncbi:hypothetical protein PAECIP111890_00629 [Paenibacillus sp. JJ-223]|nr:hypothetical protein PAECIP111890_00629 [Paenibacillus sp. JJ-223]
MIDEVSGQLWVRLCFCHLRNNIPVLGQPDLSRDKNIFPLKSLFWRLFWFYKYKLLSQSKDNNLYRYL